MTRVWKVLRALGVLALAGGLLAVVAVAGVFAYLQPKLPPTESLKDVHLQVPLRIYTRDGKLIGEFGEKRRTPVRRDQIPPLLVHAVLAAEDERFYQHPGVDWQGLVRAVAYIVRTGHKGPGGSTITMQVARNFFLGRQKTYLRKIVEIMLALKIERELSKDEILDLYFNKIFLGNRAYGVGAAAEVYYGKPLAELTLPQIAMIAGLPKAPSRFNPIANPDRARIRREYVLRRMRELGFIDAKQFETARSAPLSARVHALNVEVDAPYVAEMVRAEMEARFGPGAFTEGYKVYTTIDSHRQVAANRALRQALIAYDERHGYRGPEGSVALPADPETYPRLLAERRVVGGLAPALVLAVEDKSATVYVKRFGEVELSWNALSWARPYKNVNRRGRKPKNAAGVLAPGQLVRVRLTEDGWRLAEVPTVEGALVSLDPGDGAITALDGGFDFQRSKFNRATQAERQPESNFKPFLYSAALENGFTPATLINDAPVVFDDPGLEAAWRPENYSGKFFGPTRLRVALYKSRNLVSIRILRAIGVATAIDYIRRFGLPVERLPRNLSLALGSGTFTPLEIATAYAVLANGGYKVEPYFIQRVDAWDGKTILIAQPARVCERCETQQPAPAQGSLVKAAAIGDAVSSDAVSTSADSAPATSLAAARAPAPPRAAPRVITPQNAWIMNSILRDVIQRGTGRKARALGRKDLAGKTGTTNEQKDAWFSGFNRHLVTTTWVGFDKVATLGRYETGARAALPMWMAYMKSALATLPEAIMREPDGVVKMRIDPDTGEAASASDPQAIFEIFRVGHAPKPRVAEGGGDTAGTKAQPPGNAAKVTEQLF